MTADWWTPQPAMIVTTVRTGGTFLCHALDSHPEIGCEREEPLHPHSRWMQYMPDRLQVLDIVWHRAGYHVSMCKMTSKQFGWVPDDFIIQQKPRIILLHRENVLRSAISAAISTRNRTARLPDGSDFEVHTFRRLPGIILEFDAKALLATCRKVDAAVDEMMLRCERLPLPLLEITYNDITGGEREVNVNTIPADTGRKLCDFLGVARRPLVAGIKRVNARPLNQIIKNFAEVAAVFAGTGYEEMLKE